MVLSNTSSSLPKYIFICVGFYIYPYPIKLIQPNGGV